MEPASVTFQTSGYPVFWQDHTHQPYAYHDNPQFSSSQKPPLEVPTGE